MTLLRVILSTTDMVEDKLIVGWICKIFGAAWIARLRVGFDETVLAKD